MKTASHKKVRFFTTKHETGVSILMKKLWKEKTFADVTVIAGGQYFVAHKAVLNFFSPLLSAILLECPTEAVISIDGATADDFRSVLEIFYNGEVKLHSNQPDSVLQLLSRLGVAINTEKLTMEFEAPSAIRLASDKHESTNEEVSRVFILSSEECQGIKHFNCPHCTLRYNNPESLFVHVKDCSKQQSTEKLKDVRDRSEDKSQLLSEPSEARKSGRKRLPKSGLEIFADEQEVDDSFIANQYQERRGKNPVSVPRPTKKYKVNSIADLKCETCPNEFSNPWLMALHTDSKCNKYPSACKKCKEATRLVSFPHHIFHEVYTHYDTKCPVCQVRIDGGKSAIIPHVERHIPPEMKWFQCEICSEKFLTKKGKFSHVPLCGRIKESDDNSPVTTADCSDTKQTDDEASTSPTTSIPTVRIIKPVKKTSDMSSNSSVASETVSQELDTLHTTENTLSRGFYYRKRSKTASRRGKLSGRSSVTKLLVNIRSRARGRPRGRVAGLRRGRFSKHLHRKKEQEEQLPLFTKPRGVGRPRRIARGRFRKVSCSLQETCEVCTISLKSGRKTNSLHRRLCFQKLFTLGDGSDGQERFFECHFCKSQLHVGEDLKQAVESHYTSENCPDGYEIRTEMTKHISQMVMDDFGDTFLIEIDKADADDEIQYTLKQELEDGSELVQDPVEEVGDLCCSLTSDEQIGVNTDEPEK